MTTDKLSDAAAQAEERRLWSAETGLRFREATCRRRRTERVGIHRERSRLAPAPARARGWMLAEVRRRQVACAKAVTSHRTPEWDVWLAIKLA